MVSHYLHTVTLLAALVFVLGNHCFEMAHSVYEPAPLTRPFDLFPNEHHPHPVHDPESPRSIFRYSSIAATTITSIPTFNPAGR